MKKLFKFFLNAVPRPLLIRISYLVRPVFALFLKGDNHKDPIDGNTYRKFLPYGYGNPRENVLAPGTLSLERHRLLWLFLKDHTDFFTASHKVLHFAPEQAFYQRFRKLGNLNYTTTDLDSPLADVKADICALPFEDNTYDVILCNHVLEHIKNDKKAMQELYRVMKPGGWGIFQIPQDTERAETFEDDSITDPTERARIFGQYDHVRVYGMDFFDRLKDVGFEVVADDLAGQLTAEEAEYYRINPKELIPFCKKPI
ncbi:class I SAM-dependent methyltransferase [Robertkochia solimangrovi]|uniref:class I SAM-dependent methyltransferase n=1 Tax=Robertkochia solimangrovi TaxID=2213046 RepID=UPI0011811DD0|nr:class I SAM-dependent methyltransferase [Robertkochia solimangrovi]TRZ41404.1 SAM-dependent methyltransferase [Robertkochia solimangrovi]